MSFSRPGAIDLSSLASATSGPATAANSASSAGTGAYTVDVTEQNFQEVFNSSGQWVVVLALWSPRVPASAEFVRVLAHQADRYEGLIQLATVDVDANPRIAQALQAPSVPLAVGLIQGRSIPLFEGAVSPEDAGRYFDELVRLGAQQQMTGRAPATDASAAAVDEPVDDPRFADVDSAYASGDYAAAVAELEKMQAQSPADTEIAERLAGTRLMLRVCGAELQAARKAAADSPADIDAQLLVADLDITGGHVDDAFDRLLKLLPGVFGDDRERVRERLLELFTVVGADDERVAKARRRLATALF